MTLLKNVVENEYIFYVIYEYDDNSDEYKAEQVFAESEEAARLKLESWAAADSGVTGCKVIRLLEVNGRRV